MDQKFYLPGGLTFDEGSLPVTITAQIVQSGRPLMSNPNSCKIISKSDQRFLRRRFLRISSCLYSAKNPHSPEPCLLTDQYFANNISKGHPRNISVKLSQNLTSGFGEEDFLKFLHVHIEQEAPIHQSHVYTQIKISPTIFEKSHPRNISVKLFQNRTNGSRGEDF